MIDLASAEYYRKRESHAHALAERASIPEIKNIHREMATEYARLAREAEREPAAPVSRTGSSAVPQPR